MIGGFVQNEKNNIETFTVFTDRIFVIKKYNYNNISENNQRFSYNENRTYRLSSDAPPYKLKRRIPTMEPYVFFSKSDIDGKTKKDLNSIVTEIYNYVAYNSSKDNKKVAKFKYYDGNKSVPIDIIDLPDIPLYGLLSFLEQQREVDDSFCNTIYESISNEVNRRRIRNRLDIL